MKGQACTEALLHSLISLVQVRDSFFNEDHDIGGNTMINTGVKRPLDPFTQREKTKFEFSKYSTFDDTPKNLIVSADRESGTLILWH